MNPSPSSPNRSPDPPTSVDRGGAGFILRGVEPCTENEAYDILRELADGGSVSPEWCARLWAYVVEMEGRVA